MKNAAGKDWTYRVQLVLQRRNNAEVAAAAAQRPEQVLVFRRAGGEQRAVGGDYVGGDQVVAGEAVLPCEPSQTAPQGKTGDSGAGDHAHGCSQPKSLRLPIKFPEMDAGFGAHAGDSGIYANTFHQGKVDHQTVVADALPGDAVPPAADRDKKLMLAGDAYTGDNVRGAEAASNGGGTAVNAGVVNCPRRVIAVRSGEQQGPAQGEAKLVESVAGKHGASPFSKPESGRARHKMLPSAAGCQTLARPMQTPISSMHRDHSRRGSMRSVPR